VIKADLVVTNATIHTMNPEQPSATWFAFIGGDVVAVGDGDDVPPAKEVIDAGGLCVVPGFHDAHTHTVWFGLSLAELDCSGFASLPALYGGQQNASGGFPAGQWILAIGFNQERFGGFSPVIQKLDLALPNHPLFISHASCHTAIVNTLALGLSGVMAKMSGGGGVAGSAVVVDESENLTGLLGETAQILLQQF
jgi:predicted amidohydrolase YtcJ